MDFTVQLRRVDEIARNSKLSYNTKMLKSLTVFCRNLYGKKLLSKIAKKSKEIL